MAVTWAKMRGRLNYIELRVVTQRTYRTERSLGKFIVRPFGYVWFWKIVAARNYDPTHAPRVLARARRPYLFVPRVLSGSHPLIRLTLSHPFSLFPFRFVSIARSLLFSLSLSFSPRVSSICPFLSWSTRQAFSISDAPAFPRGERQNMRPEENDAL